MLRTLLLLLALTSTLLAGSKPDIGKRLAWIPVAEGVLSIHERGMALDYPDGSTLISSIEGEAPMVLSATWTHNSPAGPITISVTYELPILNPSDAQMRIYVDRFKRMVSAQQLVFPPVNP